MYFVKQFILNEWVKISSHSKKLDAKNQIELLVLNGVKREDLKIDYV